MIRSYYGSCYDKISFARPRHKRPAYNSCTSSFFSVLEIERCQRFFRVSKPPNFPLPLPRAPITFFLHVTMSEHSLPRYYRIEPIFAAHRFPSFTGLDFFARFSWQFRDGTKHCCKVKMVSVFFFVLVIL